MTDEKDVNGTENEQLENETSTADNHNTDETTIVDETEVSEDKKELTPEEKYVALNDRFIRLYAEFDNFRRRTNKEKLDIISNANAGVLKDIIPILDDFERAILNNENATDINAVKEGFNLIFNKSRGILESKGLKQMTAKGEVFDSELHEAIANVPAPSEDLKGKVIDDVEKGYFLNDKVIRFAKVVVGQ